MCEDVAMNSMCGVQQDLPVATVPIMAKQQGVIAATLHHLDSTHSTANQCCCIFLGIGFSHFSINKEVHCTEVNKAESN